MKDSIFLHFICGLSAGFIACCIASPADVVKTRLMSNPDSYNGVINCFSRTFKEEGGKAFYKGFVPNFTRLGVWSVTCFVTME
jgi:solute carrier family 25 uncoupling protein 8/9